MVESYIIKQWSQKDNTWYPNWFYPFKKPILPKTLGFMCKANIEKLKTKNDILKQLKKQGRISQL